MKKLSEKLHYYFFEEEHSEKISLANIFALTEERLFGFPLALIAFLSIFAIPGTSFIFGVAMLAITLQLCFGQSKPWVPQKLLQMSFSLGQLQGFMRHLIPWLKRIEKIAKPRLTPICHSLPGRIVLGIIASAMAFLVILPIPGANTVPAIAIFFTALGLQEGDGVLSLIGMAIALVFLGIIIGLLWTGSNIFQVIFQ
ncbi:exopolysaccharide synthesis, ExoD family (plasmid) [[Synechococcus] sp. NIES-970]|uniref:exopolysaccharide biosynthesis protein n=1 Tax=Picosynechococcus sp. NKBG15041c TaxID=1407650 RepID=UPI000427999F|nr:exopolysaccharide biosynthesis protein [Picosynechococcus sp. NKBG15041c]MBV5261834.1 exopolysaccharide biosynthesis protein [Synechococcus moorigangaii CMS01]BAW97835.1 exopolysaccharide synthesis, ExoD family [[Synechococcus] sp. NIES-970]